MYVHIYEHPPLLTRDLFCKLFKLIQCEVYKRFIGVIADPHIIFVRAGKNLKTRKKMRKVSFLFIMFMIMAVHEITIMDKAETMATAARTFQDILFWYLYDDEFYSDNQ